MHLRSSESSSATMQMVLSVDCFRLQATSACAPVLCECQLHR